MHKTVCITRFEYHDVQKQQVSQFRKMIMEPLPHSYRVTVHGEPGNVLVVRAQNLPELQVAPPLQFDGPGDRWSPEELLMAPIVNCFVTNSLSCEA
ncbi:MAG: hypothetical protein WBN40_03520 [Pseudomonadales bacterium]